MISDRNTLILYSAATCNLNCSFCYIDKNPALDLIDNILEESFKSDYYNERIRKYFPDANQLKKLETWGGEPFLGMDRIHNVLRRIIETYPSFTDFFSSTNFTLPDHVDRIERLLQVFAEFPNRQFGVCLQLSLDGPEWANDKTRGAGSTEKFMNVLDEFCSRLPKILPQNVNMNLLMKGTMDLDILYMLNSLPKVVDYYSAYDNVMDKIVSLGMSNVSIQPAQPNFASPSPITQKDGIQFARVCEFCRVIEGNWQEHFKYHQKIIPFSNDLIPNNNMNDNNTGYRFKNYTCGTGYTNVGLLPGDLVSACHNGFTDIMEEYKANMINSPDSTLDPQLFAADTRSRFTMTDDEYETYERQMGCYNCEGTSARLTNIVSLINLLAHAGQIDSCYKDMQEAYAAGRWYQNHTSYCIRDNYMITGSLTMIPAAAIKLLFNGAHKIIVAQNKTRAPQDIGAFNERFN